MGGHRLLPSALREQVLPDCGCTGPRHESQLYTMTTMKSKNWESKTVRAHSLLLRTAGSTRKPTLAFLVGLSLLFTGTPTSMVLAFECLCGPPEMKHVIYKECGTRLGGCNEQICHSELGRDM